MTGRCEASVNSTVLAQQTNWRRETPVAVRRCGHPAATLRIIRSGEWSQNVYRIKVCRQHRRSEYAFPFDWDGSIVLRISPQAVEGDRTFRTLAKYLAEEANAR